MPIPGEAKAKAMPGRLYIHTRNNNNKNKINNKTTFVSYLNSPRKGKASLNGRRPQKKYLFLIPLKFRGKPFLGLAQLSKIFIYFISIIIISSVNIKPTRHRFGFSLAWDWQLGGNGIKPTNSDSSTGP